MKFVRILRVAENVSIISLGLQQVVVAFVQNGQKSWLQQNGHGPHAKGKVSSQKGNIDLTTFIVILLIHTIARF